LLDSFLNLLYSSKTHPRFVDRMLWIPTRNHSFEVKSNSINLHSREHCMFPWKSVWNVNAPPCIAFFTWTIALGRVLMIDNLRRRGFTLINFCFLCKKNEETINLIHCELLIFGTWFSTYPMFCGLCLATTLLKGSRTKRPTRANLESHFHPFNTEHLERKKSMTL
jgi:hypothetical protein